MNCRNTIYAVVIFIFYIFIVTYFLQLHWYFKWRIEAIANKPEKNFRTSTGFEPVVEGLKTQFFLGFICSCLNCNYHWEDHHIHLKYQCNWRKQVTIMITKGKMLDLWSNSFKLFFDEMYGDWSGEFVCRYWCFKS